MTRALILGGYGNFGKRIARALTAAGFPVIIAGRSVGEAAAFARTLPAALVESLVLEVTGDMRAALARLCPAMVVTTCGPFQTSDYQVARARIAQRVHYVDLADGRDFVSGMVTLDAAARRHDVAVISGTSQPSRLREDMPVSRVGRLDRYRWGQPCTTGRAFHTAVERRQAPRHRRLPTPLAVPERSGQQHPTQRC
jgi:NAD(P)-dependent dehydrogenase (short-subunit alcohol dehydrogenase family)